MQASTSEQFLLSVILEYATATILQEAGLTKEMLGRLGFETSESNKVTLEERILSFEKIQKSVSKHSEEVSKFTDVEASVYQKNKHATYFAA